MSFAELVNGFLLPYELNDSEIDDYWRPQAENCNICAVNYTFIGKVTSFSNDMALLVDTLNQKSSIGKFIQDKRFCNFSLNLTETLKEHADRTDSFDVLEHFTGLDIEKRQKLYNLYKSDYLAFNYPYPAHLGI